MTNYIPTPTETNNDDKDSNIQLFDINGTVLPLEQKPGKADEYSIPRFILQEEPIK